MFPEFVGITDPEHYRARIEELVGKGEGDQPNLMWDSQWGPFEQLQIEGAPGARRHGATKAVEIGSGSPAHLTRGGFLAFIDQIARPFMEIGAGPDGFALLARLGFTHGYEITGSSIEWHTTQPEPSPANKAESRGTEAIEKLAYCFAQAGIADIEVGKLWVTRGTDGYRNRSLGFEIVIRRHDRAETTGSEKYAVGAFAELERELFDQLRNGCPEGVALEVHAQGVNELYLESLQSRWQHTLRILDWYLIGSFRGAACRIAVESKFDTSEPRVVPTQHHDVVGQAAKVQVVDSSPRALRVQVNYNANLPARAP